MSIRDEYLKKGWKKLPPGGIIDKPATSLEYKTGTWKTFKPVRDPEKCPEPDKCLLCWLYCPEGCIERIDGDLYSNLDYCKGCGTCAHECPRKAIEMVRE